MGNSIFKNKKKKVNENKEEKVNTYAYDLRELEDKTPKTISLLLLGIPGSGKSTVLHQIEKMYNGSIEEHILNNAMQCIQQNLLRTIHFLATQNMLLKSSYPSCQLTEKSQQICTDIVSCNWNAFQNTILKTNFAANISILWEDKGLQETFKICKYRKYPLMDNIEYFFDHSARMLHPKYQTTFEDFIRFKQKTETVITSQVSINEEWKFNITDVGGSRKQRKTWLRCFTDIHAIIFVMSLVSYDEVIGEHNTLFLSTLFNGYIREIQQVISYQIPSPINDMCLQYYERKSALTETFEVFDKSLKHSALATVDAIVFFNKNDLFIPKIKEIAFNVSENEDIIFLTHEPDAMKDHLRKRFKKSFYGDIKQERSPRRIHFHVCSATSTSQLQMVFHLIQFETVRKLMRVGMLM